MIPDTAGATLDEARRILDAAGIKIDAVETISPPGCHKKREGDTSVPAVEYVAVQYESGPGAVRLRVVSAPGFDLEDAVGPE